MKMQWHLFFRLMQFVLNFLPISVFFWAEAFTKGIRLKSTDLLPIYCSLIRWFGFKDGWPKNIRAATINCFLLKWHHYEIQKIFSWCILAKAVNNNKPVCFFKTNKNSWLIGPIKHHCSHNLFNNPLLPQTIKPLNCVLLLLHQKIWWHKTADRYRSILPVYTHHRWAIRRWYYWPWQLRQKRIQRRINVVITHSLHGEWVTFRAGLMGTVLGVCAYCVL